MRIVHTVAVPDPTDPQHRGPWASWDVIHMGSGRVITTMAPPQPQNLAQAVADPMWISPLGCAQHLAAELNAHHEPDADPEVDYGLVCDRATGLRIAGVV